MPKQKLPEPVPPNSEVKALTTGDTSLTKIKSQNLGSQTKMTPGPVNRGKLRKLFQGKGLALGGSREFYIVYKK